MDKPSKNSKPGQLEPTSSGGYVEVKVDSVSTVLYNKKVSVKLRSLYDARLEYTGQTSGKQYQWNKAGSIVEVDAEDSEILLAKRIGGKLCCGNSRDVNKLFELIAD
jgi:hypothetical protein